MSANFSSRHTLNHLSPRAKVSLNFSAAKKFPSPQSHRDQRFAIAARGPAPVKSCKLKRPTIAQLLLILALAASALPSRAAELHLGSGVKAGEITDRSAIVLVRLTNRPDQDDQGHIPGAAGQVRLRYSQDAPLETLRGAVLIATAWESTKADADWSVQFRLTDLKPAMRCYYQVEYRTDPEAPANRSESFSFLTAPPPDKRWGVTFHLTTCQDLHGPDTYKPMAAQKPDFCVSAGDTVYYDGQCLARNVPQAYQAFQKMFGLRPMVDYYKHVGGYFMKDDHDFRFNDSDPHMEGRWVNQRQNDPLARYTKTRGNLKLDVNWLTAAEGAQVFRQVFPMSEKPYRTFRWGKGVQIWLTESREFRSPNDMPDGPDKTIWGAEEKAWLKKTLLESDADYRIIISPNTIIGPDRIMKGDNHANINGFWYEGQAFLDWLSDNKLTNVILMCGDRHWQYHSIDKRSGRSTHEFSCGPTHDDHVQPVPPNYQGVDRPYSASRGGFMTISYKPDRTLTCQFHSMAGEPLYKYQFAPQ